MQYSPRSRTISSTHEHAQCSRDERPRWTPLAPLPTLYGRNVGTVLVLRHAGPAHALHDQRLPASRRQPGLQHLRSLRGLGLRHAVHRRCAGRSVLGQTTGRHHRRPSDECRTLVDGGGKRAGVLPRARAAHRGQWLLQTKHLHDGRRAVSQRCQTRLWVHDLLHRHQLGRRFGPHCVRLHR